MATKKKFNLEGCHEHVQYTSLNLPVHCRTNHYKHHIDISLLAVCRILVTFHESPSAVEYPKYLSEGYRFNSCWEHLDFSFSEYAHVTK